MNAGDLNRRVTIQQLSTTQDTYGQPVNTWNNVATVWAAVEPLTTGNREILAAQEINSEVNIRIRIRYYPGLTAAMRVVYGTRIFDIQAVIDLKEQHVEMYLMCKEVFLDAG